MIVNPQLRRVLSSQEKKLQADDRLPLAKALLQQRKREREGHYLEGDAGEQKAVFYTDSHISRGVEKVHLGEGPGYNFYHGVDFYRLLDDLFEKNPGTVRVLDTGCALGCFLKDLREHAERTGNAGRLEVHGITLTKGIRALDTKTQQLRAYEPVLGKDAIHVAHGEKIPFPDDHFHMVVSTFGPETYYRWPNGLNRTEKLAQEALRVTAPGSTIYVVELPPQGWGENDRLLESYELLGVQTSVRMEKFLRIQVKKSQKQ